MIDDEKIESITENKNDEIIPDGSLWDDIDSNTNNPFDTVAQDSSAIYESSDNNADKSDTDFDDSMFDDDALVPSTEDNEPYDQDEQSDEVEESSEDNKPYEQNEQSDEVEENIEKDVQNEAPEIENDTEKEKEELMKNETKDDANISIIINKIDDLVAKYNLLKDENESLQSEIVNTKVKCELAEKNIQDLEEEVSCKDLEIQSILKKVNSLNI
jgi:chromosome segregation ATPase